MSVGEQHLIEVEHPSCAEDGCRPRLHLSAVASSRAVACNDALRHRFAAAHGVLALDSELDAAVESVIGNRRDSFLILRGIADYKDGGTRRDWQPFAALAAASVMKAVICAMEPLND
jgi:nucleoside phosphorylase